MSLTGVDLLGRSIGKASAWPAGIDAGLGTSDRRLACCVLQAWLSGLQDRMARRHMPAGLVAQAFALLPADVRDLLEPGAGGPAAAGPPPAAGRWQKTLTSTPAGDIAASSCGRATGLPGRGSSPVTVKG